VGAVTGANGKTGTTDGGTEAADGRRGPGQPAGAAAPPPDVARLAEESGFGAAHGSHALGGGDLGCLGGIVTVVLLPPGIGLTAGPGGTAATAVGAALLALAVVSLPLGLLAVRRREHRIPRLHLFDGGIVLTRPPAIAACPWSDIRLVEHTVSTAVGQGGAQVRVNRLRLEHVDGTPLCSLGPAVPFAPLTRLALAGGAHT
jgi:hypothetical protein